MKRLILVVLCVLAFPVMASHIVGGEFEIIHVTGNSYRINLIIYFDELNGNPGARDAQAVARIFRKRDNAFMRDVTLTLDTQTPVSYTQPSCSHGEVVTTKIIYTTNVIFPDATYSDPAGYYIAWERCCRNYTITNIISNDPQFGTYAGQTFYLEFPPVVKEGQPFFNSTPRLFPPLNDYACPNKLYYVNFAGRDDDGDSLVYSLAEPLNTFTGEAIPINGPRPRPYPTIQWRAPYSFSNIFRGNPDLRISEDGFITVTPTTQGLFVFAVKCEEFRNGEKIGEVRRDFQLLVVDRCPEADPPSIVGKKLNDPDVNYTSNLSVSFSNTTGDGDRCVQVRVSDPDASKASESFREFVALKVIPIGFKADLAGIHFSDTSATLINGSTRTFEICFPDCPYKNGPYKVGIVARDDACSLPLTDTLFVTVNVQPPPNVPVEFTTPDVLQTVNEGDKITWNIQAKDDDSNQIIMGFVPIGFSSQPAGFTFSQSAQQGDIVDAQLTWDANCSVYDFTHKTNFEIWIVAEDIDHCNVSNPDIMKFNLSLLIPPNNVPIIDTDLTSAPFEDTVRLTKKIYENLTFNVTGQDADNDHLVLTMKGQGFSPAAIGVTFPQPTTNTGVVQSPFTWDIPCDNINLKIKDTYTFNFIVLDQENKCHFQNDDTVTVMVTLIPPDNTKPTLLVNSLNASQPITDGTLTTFIGEQINLGIYGDDSDTGPEANYLHLSLIDARGTFPPEGYVFAPAEGSGHVETTFSWNPICSIFKSDTDQNRYKFTFAVHDNGCNNILGDTVAVNIVINDKESSETEFLPPNIITPNGDHCNDYFAMEGVEPSDLCEVVTPTHLPIDNCKRKFENIQIFNRWGKLVYRSDHRDFRWYAYNEPNGVYFYLLKYSDKEYKGSVTVRY